MSQSYLEEPFVEGLVRDFVRGEWVASEHGEAYSVENPATGEELAKIHYGGTKEVDRAVQAAVDAFEEWREVPVVERVQPMFRFKTLLDEHQDEIAEILVREHGKTFAEAAGEVRRGIENVEVACGAPTLMQAGHLEYAAPGIDETAVRHPLGVFTGITPFNFPAMIPLWFLPYAVACGNTYVLKPSEKDPLTAQALFRLLEEAGFPDGVVNLVNGDAETVQHLLAHDDIVGVTFVGSTPVAKEIYATAAEHGKRVQAQGGAKNHIVVSQHADLPFAADQTVGSSFANSGQRCLANPVAVVHDAIYEEFSDLVVELAADLTVGNGLDDGVDMGPLITPEHKQHVINYIQLGDEEGADLLLDGRKDPVSREGSCLAPTVFGEVTTDMVIAQEEIFGPVLALIRAESFDAAIQVVNGSRFGNAASLFTTHGSEASRFKKNVNAGNIGINVGTAAPMAFFHFGGAKDSFFGDLHAQAEDVVRFYTDEKILIERWP